MIEITEKRTSHAKTYDLGNGQHRLTASLLPIHYEENGVWHDVDMTIQKGKIRSGIYHVDLLPNKIGFKAIDRKTGNGISIEFIGGHYAQPTITDNYALWEEVLPGVDIKFVFRNHQANIFRILKDDHAPKTAKWKVTEDSGEKTLFFNPKIRGVDANKRQTKHTVDYKNGILTDTFEGKVFERDKKTRVRSEIVPTYPVEIDPTITITISNTADDGWAIRRKSGGGGTTSLAIHNSYSYEYVKYTTRTAGPVKNDFRAYFRFPGITIPIGSTINSAAMQPFISFKNQSPALRFLAKKLNNPNAPTLGSQIFNSATLATNVVNKSMTTASGNAASVDVKTIVQELVTAFDYSNEAMLFFVKKPVGSPITNYKSIAFEDLSRGIGHPAQLVIDYTAGGGSTFTPRLTLLGCG